MGNLHNGNIWNSLLLLANISTISFCYEFEGVNLSKQPISSLNVPGKKGLASLYSKNKSPLGYYVDHKSYKSYTRIWKKRYIYYKIDSIWWLMVQNQIFESRSKRAEPEVLGLQQADVIWMVNGSDLWKWVHKNWSRGSETSANRCFISITG